ncbi:MAG: mechanosensitive ion channel family protein [Leptolyngbyaceae cyanobacterium bins.302]|nr:mechanosensitive ion channel family protein [Leptolyngbyaceae cyanobacterium bins.302]
MFIVHGWHLKQFRRYLVLACLVLLLGLGRQLNLPIAAAQLPSFTSPSSNIQAPPVGVERRGTLESAAVRLDGRELFRIASPTVLNRNEPGILVPVEARARQVEVNLARVIAEGKKTDAPTLNPNTLQVVIETVNGQPVLFVKDTGLAEAQVLLTVTNTDAQFHATSSTNLARKWQAILQKELRQAVELRKPDAFRQQVTTVIFTTIATVLLTLVFGTIWAFLGRRKHHLEKRRIEERRAAEAEAMQQDLLAAESPDVAVGRQPLHEVRHHVGIQRRLQFVRFLRWLLFWAIAFVWVVGIAYSLNTFPQTRQFAKRVVTIPIVLLFAWFVTGFTNRVTDLLTDRFIQSRELKQSLTETSLQRITTIANVIKGLKMVLLYAIAILWVLQWLNLIPGSILTLGALLALVISFAAQNLVKDLVNGFLILFEDQFRIGDMIRVGTTSGLTEVSGLVENLNLRITQLRNETGNLITVPNSSIAQVENMSRDWSRADFRIEVAYNTDVDRAIAVVRETLSDMAQDPDWQALILDSQEMLGVEQLSHTGILIRVWIKTIPLKQWIVVREVRRRIKIAFDRHHIQIGTPQQIWMGNHNSNSSPIEDAQPGSAHQPQ